MSTLLRASESKPISVFGRLIPIRLAHWIARIWIVAVVVGSLLPGPAKEKIGAGAMKPAGHVTTKHRLIHVFSFGSSCFLLSLLAWNRREELQAGGEVLAVGCLVELAQFVVYADSRMFEWWDVRDDAIGIALALVAVQLVHRATSATADVKARRERVVERS